MQALIGETLVKNLKPAGKPYEVRDTRLKGLLLRVQPSGSMTYYVEYGRGRRTSLGRCDHGGQGPQRGQDHPRTITGATRRRLDKVKRSRVDDRATVRYLTEDELKRLLAALDAREERLRAGRDRPNAWRTERGYSLLPDLRQNHFADHLKPMVLISIHTGVRYGELATLAWSDLAIDRALLTVRGHNAKSLRTRHIPLNAVALSTIQA